METHGSSWKGKGTQKQTTGDKINPLHRQGISVSLTQMVGVMTK